MPISVTEPAANLLKKTLLESGLNPETHAVDFANLEGNLAMAFIDDFGPYKEFFGLKVVALGINEDIVVDYYSVSDGREGIIYLGKEEYANYIDPQGSDGSQEDTN